MFLRSTSQKKDGKLHRYFGVLEKPHLAWRANLEVFDEAQQSTRTLSLLPDDRELPADAIDSVQVKINGLELRRPRVCGNCWLACGLRHQLGPEEFWRVRLEQGREAVN